MAFMVLMAMHSSAATHQMQQRRCFDPTSGGATVDVMENEHRRAKVTPETREESARLKKLWDERSHPGQAEFGELYEIGNQSAVGQFLRGQTPLSLKAARGFAQGLGCKIEDFSPRLAAKAATIAHMVPGESLRPEVAQVAAAINRLPKAQQDWVLMAVHNAIDLARETLIPPPPTDPTVTAVGTESPPAKKRLRAG